jgi:hypothetical protein
MRFGSNAAKGMRSSGLGIGIGWDGMNLGAEEGDAVSVERRVGGVPSDAVW